MVLYLEILFLSPPLHIFSYLKTKEGLLVCTRTQHWAQLISRLVPSSATWGLDSWPSPASLVLLNWVLKHISGIKGLDHWRPPERFVNIKQEFPLNSVYCQSWVERTNSRGLLQSCFRHFDLHSDTSQPPNRKASFNIMIWFCQTAVDVCCSFMFTVEVNSVFSLKMLHIKSTKTGNCFYVW